MLGRWIRSHDPRRPFVITSDGILTFGDVAAARDTVPMSGQLVVEPGSSMDSVVDLMLGPDEGAQLVVLDPGLPAAERGRRLDVARGAATRDAMTILFTSGTTGSAKGVRLTAANWEAAAAASAAHLAHQPSDVWLAAMPLHHVGGLSILYRSAFVGAAVRWVPRFDDAEVVAALRHDVTIASLVPTMLHRILAYDSGAYSGLRAVLVGGASIPDGLLEEAHRRGIPALPTYGMTETCAQVASLRPGSGPRYAAHPLPGVEVRIAEDHRIQVRGRQVSPGYADEGDRPTGEWFTTPDRGEIESDGALRVLGRADEVIVTGGENVSPERVEAVFRSHPEVVEVVVIGVEDPEWGQRVGAVYVGSVEKADLLVWARSRLARYEVPGVIQKLEAIPTLDVGKPDRSEVLRLLR